MNLTLNFKRMRLKKLKSKDLKSIDQTKDPRKLSVITLAPQGMACPLQDAKNE
jgi:hypothetical protein